MNIGAGWKKTGENTGIEFKSCLISIPVIGKLNFAIFKVDSKKTDLSPDYRIVCDNKEVGVGWLKQKDGKPWMSCLIPMLGMKSDLNFALFENDKKTEDKHPDYNIAWSYYEAENSDGGMIPQNSNPTPEDNPFSDDDIPF